ncbi:MAG: hypothetical protein IPH13_21425 [Planctomycetes bacterium]|nr:hypothetical protein [Planctomycetota bacterium]MCC7169894.1 hypothetical protein [Planctomycetota bacterium]
MNARISEHATGRGTPWACLVAALASMPDDTTTRARRYFADIEAHFDLLLSPFSAVPVPAPTRAEWVAAVHELMLVLLERLRRRVGVPASDAGVAIAAPPLTARQRATARATATLLRAITLRAFPEFDVDTTRFADAMERYANGELRWFYDVPLDAGGRARFVACEPDSSYHALWAEFALLALELSAEPEFQRRSLPTYVESMQLYGEVYVGAQPKAAVGSRGWFDTTRQASPILKELLRCECGAMGLDALVARHVVLVRRYCAV